MPTLRRWTEDQISNLKNLGPKHPASAEAVAQLDRSPSGTAVKAHELKLSSKMRRQTTEEPAASGVDPGPAGFDWQE
jgi:hypothetical protein